MTGEADGPTIATLQARSSGHVFDQEAMTAVFSEGVMTILPGDEHVKLVFFDERPSDDGAIMQRSNLILTMPRSRFLKVADLLGSVAANLRREGLGG